MEVETAMRLLNQKLQGIDNMLRWGVITAGERDEMRAKAIDAARAELGLTPVSREGA